MIATLLLSLPLAAPQTDEPAPPPAPVVDEAPRARALSTAKLKDEIDVSLRWLRGRQDAETGSYGKDELATVRVLLAFAGSPRAYRYSDGPFVSRAVDWLLARQREDGTFGAKNTGVAQRHVITRLAVRLFELLGDDVTSHARVRALAALGLTELPPDTELALVSSMDDDRLLDIAAAMLQQRHGSGSWDIPLNPLHATAAHTWRLSTYHRILRSRAPASAPGTASPLPAFDPADRARATKAVERGAAYLLSQAEDGLWGFGGQADPGITSMVVGALLATPEPRPAEVQAAVDGALDWLASLQKEDGSIHVGQLANYVTSASVLALSKAGHERHAGTIAKARGFLQQLQADGGEGYSEGDRFYGGVGYGGDERPDLSNLQMALDALAAAGVKKGDPTFEKALVFLQRCQNRSESNTLEVATDDGTVVSGNDGGAGYAPGESKAGYVTLPDGKKVARSYGSMTYALLKGYLFAGLPKDDPRVQAAWRWLTKNYTLDVNPGFEASSDPTAAYQGLYYYFFTMARALDLFGEESVVDAAGNTHAWRAELSGRLVSLQRQDGSWVNTNASRWYEGNPVLATAYALLTLESALPETAAQDGAAKTE